MDIKNLIKNNIKPITVLLAVFLLGFVIPHLTSLPSTSKRLEAKKEENLLLQKEISRVRLEYKNYVEISKSEKQKLVDFINQSRRREDSLRLKMEANERAFLREINRYKNQSVKQLENEAEKLYAEYLLTITN